MPWPRLHVLIALLRPRVGLLTLLFLGVLLPLLVFGELAEDVWEHEGFSWDAPILWFLHAHATPTLDHLMVTVTDLAGPIQLAALSAVLFATLVVLRRVQPALLFGLGVAGAAGLNVLAKWVFHRPRPHLWSTLVAENDSGFPSGHAMVTMALGVTLVLPVRRFERITQRMRLPFRVVFRWHGGAAARTRPARRAGKRSAAWTEVSGGRRPAGVVGLFALNMYGVRDATSNPPFEGKGGFEGGAQGSERRSAQPCLCRSERRSEAVLLPATLRFEGSLTRVVDWRS